MRKAAQALLSPAASKEYLPIQEAEATQLQFDILTTPEVSTCTIFSAKQSWLIGLPEFLQSHPPLQHLDHTLRCIRSARSTARDAHRWRVLRGQHTLGELPACRSSPFSEVPSRVLGTLEEGSSRYSYGATQVIPWTLRRVPGARKRGRHAGYNVHDGPHTR